MNLWFWDQLIPDWKDRAPDTTLFGIGTILTRVALQQHPKSVICGSGTGYGQISKLKGTDTSVSWVRGPNTAKILGIDSKLAISDPACMVVEMDPFVGNKKPSGKTLFIPHRLTSMLDINWNRISEALGVETVSPQCDAKYVITQIMNADLVLAESMHAAIIADAFRVPWIAIEISHHFNAFKWNDWAQSVEVDLTVHSALKMPKDAYFFLRGRQAAVKRTFTRTRSERSKPAQLKDGGRNFSNPNYLEKEGRDFVKQAIARFSGVFETLLIRDLRKIMISTPSLSQDRVVQDRRDQIRERVRLLENAFF